MLLFWWYSFFFQYQQRTRILYVSAVHEVAYQIGAYGVDDDDDDNNKRRRHSAGNTMHARVWLRGSHANRNWLSVRSVLRNRRVRESYESIKRRKRKKKIVAPIKYSKSIAEGLLFFFFSIAYMCAYTDVYTYISFFSFSSSSFIYTKKKRKIKRNRRKQRSWNYCVSTTESVNWRERDWLDKEEQGLEATNLKKKKKNCTLLN